MGNFFYINIWKCKTVDITSLVKYEFEDIYEHYGYVLHYDWDDERIGPNNYVIFASREWPEPSQRPVLEITYSVPNQAPNPPTGVTARTGSSSGEIDLSWNASSGATGYVIVYDEDGNNPPWTPTQNGTPGTVSDIGNVAQVTISGLTAGERYYFAVAAYNSAGLGDYSSVVSATAGSETTPTPSNGNRLAIDYGGNGLFLYDQASGRTQIDTVDPHEMVAVDIDSDGIYELAVSFYGYGLYIYDETSGWNYIDFSIPEAMIQYGLEGLSGSADALACISSISLNQSVNGSWTSDCESINRPGAYAKYFTFSLSSAAEVQIDLESSVDTYLYLLSGSGMGGSVITSDDDGGSSGFNSRIITILSPGTYTIEATTWGEGQTGSFTLTLASG
jgi:hypothetical protein